MLQITDASSSSDVTDNSITLYPQWEIDASDFKTTRSLFALVDSTTSPAILYVSAIGSDSNDGRSWKTAKKTIYAAMEALPGGSTTPPTAGGGTINVAEGSMASPVPKSGIWILGHGDPNYAKPPRGWLRTSGNSLQIVGADCVHANANSATGGQCWISPGDGADAVHPAVWLSGMAVTMKFKDLGVGMYPGLGIRLGVTTTGDRTGPGGVQNVTFENVSVILNQIPGNGPGVDIGSNCFNIWFHGSTFSGNVHGQALIAKTGLSRSRNIVAVTTQSPHGFLSGDNVGIFNTNDSSFNGSFRNIEVTGGNTFTVVQNGPDAVSGGGAVISDKSESMVIDPGSGSGSGLIFFRMQ